MRNREECARIGVMTRKVKSRELENTRLAANYGGWMYCDSCGENIGYLCYSTYDRLKLKYRCNCGSEGSVILDFEDSGAGKECADEMLVVKNRMCCPNDKEPLITILDKKVASYEMEITCKGCGGMYCVGGE